MDIARHSQPVLLHDASGVPNKGKSGAEEARDTPGGGELALPCLGSVCACRDYSFVAQPGPNVQA